MIKANAPPASITNVATSVVQRKCSCNENKTVGVCETCSGSKEANEVGNTAPQIVNEVLQSAGNGLDRHTDSEMSLHFGHDFSRVRIHTDSKAAESAREVNSIAYTVGNDIVFDSGKFAPNESNGKHLLAHELTHVVQQSEAHRRGGKLEIGETNNLFEKEANQKAFAFTTGIASPIIKSGTRSFFLQRQTPGAPAFLPQLHLSSDEVVLDEGDAINSENAKLVSLASSFKKMLAANPREYIKLSTYLSDSSKLNSSKAAAERSQLQQRMGTAQSVLVKLGVPAESIEIESATMFSSKGAGRITASLYKAPRSLPPMLSLPPVSAPSAPASTGGSGLGDMLSFKFSAGSLQFAVELPKSVAIKLPVALRGAKALSLQLKAESSGEFSFGISWDDSYVNISAKAAVKIEKEKGATGSAGLEITTKKTVCRAPSPQSLKDKITAAGEKLTKALKELEAAEPDERLMKLADVAGPIGEMYDAVDKAKSGCTEVPRATFNLGIQGPIGSSNEQDPTKKAPSSIGASVTIPF